MALSTCNRTPLEKLLICIGPVANSEAPMETQMARPEWVELVCSFFMSTLQRCFTQPGETA